MVRKIKRLLRHSFLKKYDDFPSHMNALGKFVYLRTYSRFLIDEKRRETWKETIRRSVEYNVGLVIQHAERIGIPYDFEQLQKEAEELFDAEYNLEQSLSGRTKWVGGADSGIANNYPLSNFNCAFTNIEEWSDLADLFYLLLIGTGVGFKCTLEMARNLPPIRTDIEVIHLPYNGKEMHLENTVLREVDEETIMISVGDSKEGWVEALSKFFDVLTSQLAYTHIKKIELDYRHIRPKGARLKRFGGTASGPEPLQTMFEGFMRVLRNEIDPTLAPLELAEVELSEVVEEVIDKINYYHVRPIHILDMGNLIGNNVVVGGVRRTAEIFLFDADDFESLWAKYGVNGYWKEADFQKHEALGRYCKEHGIKVPTWFNKIGERFYDEKINVDFVTKEPRREADGSLSPYNFGTGFYHRAMSNNSIAFVDKPSFKFLDFIFEMMQSTGEPGFINIYEAARRRLAEMGIKNPEIIRNYARMIGLNPCAEIILFSKGVCNLTTMNVKKFVDGKVLNKEKLLQAVRRSTRAGVRMTLVELELSEWNKVQQRDRLIGPSVTHWQDMIDITGMTELEEEQLLREMRDVVREEGINYARQLRIPAPLLDTTVKPEGTLTQVFGGGSSGLHRGHSEYFIRRIRISATDALAKTAMMQSGWTVNPENGTPGDTYEEKMKNATTIVVDFPVYAGTTRTKDNVTVKEQFDTYFRFQNNYTAHNSSNTITVKEHEWKDARDIVFENWDNFVGVSFLAHDGGTYQLAPYEAITKEQYEELKSRMSDLNLDVLQLFETDGESDIGNDGCENGICPVR